MSNNSFLQLVGHKDNILLSFNQAEKVDDIFANSQISSDFVIRLKNPSITFKKGSIRMIEVNSDTSTNNKEDYYRIFYQEERDNRRKYLSWSPKKKGSYTDIFEGLFKISVGRDADAEEINKAKEIQEKFFIENPNRTLCDLNLLKPIIPMIQKTISPFHTGFFRVVEKAVFRDMFLSGQLKNNIELPKTIEPKPNENIFEMKDRIKNNRKEDKQFDESVKSALDNF